MYNYKITLSYDGGGFAGWQKQGNAENTVQGKLEAVACRLAGCTVDINGAGRTDAGVHALGQVANFKLKHYVPEKTVQEYFNRYLPETICVNSVELADERFHARLSAMSKTYMYNIDINDAGVRDVFMRKYAYNYDKKLDMNTLSDAAGRLCGEHDFAGFCTKAPKNKSTLRRLFSVRVEESEARKNIIKIFFTGSGFLYNQVRIMVGTLLEIGAGEKGPETIEEIFDIRERAIAGFTAPPQGLFLYSVEYKV